MIRFENDSTPASPTIPNNQPDVEASDVTEALQSTEPVETDKAEAVNPASAAHIGNALLSRSSSFKLKGFIK